MSTDDNREEQLYEDISDNLDQFVRDYLFNDGDFRDVVRDYIFQQEFAKLADAPELFNEEIHGDE